MSAGGAPHSAWEEAPPGGEDLRGPYLHTYIHAYIYTHIIYIYIYIITFIYIYMYNYMCVCVYIYIDCVCGCEKHAGSRTEAGKQTRFPVSAPWSTWAG